MKVYKFRKTVQEAFVDKLEKEYQTKNNKKKNISSITTVTIVKKRSLGKAIKEIYSSWKTG